jgi:hypothetical protein
MREKSEGENGMNRTMQRTKGESDEKLKIFQRYQTITCAKKSWPNDRIS